MTFRPLTVDDMVGRLELLGLGGQALARGSRVPGSRSKRPLKAVRKIRPEERMK
jgi:hypothetical protein